jgi:hypothetical protein
MNQLAPIARPSSRSGEGGSAGRGLVDLIQDRIFRHVGDDAQAGEDGPSV